MLGAKENQFPSNVRLQRDKHLKRAVPAGDRRGNFLVSSFKIDVRPLDASVRFVNNSPMKYFEAIRDFSNHFCFLC
jgi:hypothetical protein